MTSIFDSPLMIRRLACLAALLLAACTTPATATPTAVPPSVTASPVPAEPATPIPPSGTPRPSATPRPTQTSTAPPTETPPVTEAATAVPPTTASSADPFTPTTASMFETAIGQDTMTGTCTGGPILPAYGLVVITPLGDSLTWDDQEPGLYTFARTGPNVFYYSGPTGSGDGTVSLSLQFTGTTTLVMQRAFVPGSDPACTHTHHYTGEFQWLMP